MKNESNFTNINKLMIFEKSGYYPALLKKFGKSLSQVVSNNRYIIRRYISLFLAT